MDIKISQLQIKSYDIRCRVEFLETGLIIDQIRMDKCGEHWVLWDNIGKAWYFTESKQKEFIDSVLLIVEKYLPPENVV